MLNSSLCDYSNAYIVFEGIINTQNKAVINTDASNINIKIILKNCALPKKFTTKIKIHK